MISIQHWQTRYSGSNSIEGLVAPSNILRRTVMSEQINPEDLEALKSFTLHGLR